MKCDRAMKQGGREMGIPEKLSASPLESPLRCVIVEQLGEGYVNTYRELFLSSS